jgi:protein TonB
MNAESGWFSSASSAVKGFFKPQGPAGHNAPARLTAALALSAALHLSLIYGITVVPPSRQADRAVIHARIGPALPESPAGPMERSPPALPSLAPARVQAEPEKPEEVQTRNEPEPAAGAKPFPTPAPLPPVEMPLLADPTWYPAKQLDEYPRLIARVEPQYPDQAKTGGMAGEVTLLLMVDEFGTVHDASVVQAQPEGYFEEPALAAFRDARFVPATKDGRVVRSRILVRVSFNPDRPREQAAEE